METEEAKNGKVLQGARGFIYFEDKHLAEVKTAFGKFHFDEANFSFFSSLDHFGQTLNCPGIFVAGRINEKYASAYVIKMFRKLMALNEEIKNADLTLERENPLEAIRSGASCGTYTGVYFLSNSTKDNVLRLAKEVERLVSPEDLWLRGKTTEAGSLFCLDVIANTDYNTHRQEIEGIASSLNLQIKGYVNTNLYKTI
jgi:hypothetical protein